MEVFGHSACWMLIVLQCFMIHGNQANPVSSSSSKDVNPTNIVVTETLVSNAGSAENRMDLSEDKTEKSNFDNEATKVREGDTAPPTQPSQVPTSDTGLDTMLLPDSMKTNEASVNGQLNDVARTFTKKVLNAFFAELKNRPELVDEILKRETYRLLMSTEMNDDSYDHLPLGAGLTQDLLFGPKIQAVPLEDEDIENIDGFSKSNENGQNIAEVENSMPKKDTQPSNIEKPKSKEPEGDGAEGDGLAIPTSLTKENDVVEVQHGKEDQSDAPDVDKNPNDISLLEPYYYYVYYDENEDTNSEPSGKSSEPSPVILNPDNKITPKNDEIKSGEDKNTLDSVDKRKPSQGVLVDGLANVIRSAIAKDMEKQLSISKSKMALANFPAPEDLSEDVNVISNPVGDSGVKGSPADEETELTELAEKM